MNVALLGGYGNAGVRIAEMLAKRPGIRILILGRNEQKAQNVAERLTAKSGILCDAGAADASSTKSLAPYLEEADLLIVASSTTRFVRSVAEACIVTGTDYFDIQLSSKKKLEVLRELEPRIVESGLCFITDGGFHPGVPGALIRYAARRIEHLSSAHVGGAFAVDWGALEFSDETTAEFAEELTEADALVMVDGEWLRGWKHTRKFVFRPPFGETTCVPMALEEIREAVAEIPTVTNTGFFVGGSGFVLDWIVFPLGYALVRVAPTARRTAGRLLFWGFERFAPKEGGSTLVLDAAGHNGGEQVEMRIDASDEDAYHFTAAPVAETVFQYLDGQRSPGLRTQAGFVEPERFLSGLQELGVEITISESS